MRLFKDIKYNKIITIEASGIAPAIMVGYLTNLPVVFVKKKQPKTMEGMITSVVHSLLQRTAIIRFCEQQLSYS